MPNSIQRGDRKLGLIGIDLPRVNVERGGLAALTGLSKRTLNYNQRKLAQVSTARRRYRYIQKTSRGQRKLAEFPGRSLNNVRRAGCGRVAITAAPNREDARVVSVSFFEQSIESPFTAGDYREAWRAIPKHLGSTNVLERLFRRPQVLPKIGQ